jgi:putative transposase
MCNIWATQMNVRRYYIPNSIVFITQIVDQRKQIFTDESVIDLLKSTLRTVKLHHPFTMVGYVFMPDHFHLLVKPGKDSNFCRMMQSLKANFTKAYKMKLGITAPTKFWQKSYWDHVIRSDTDFERHLDYIHYNPVHHGYVNRPEEWRHSSFMQWRERGAYPPKWGWSLPTSLPKSNGNFGEMPSKSD